MKRFARFDHCAQIAEGVWREECSFAQAEHLSRQKDRPGALDACHASQFSTNCEQHVLDSLAMDLRAATAAEVAAAYAEVAGKIQGKNSELDFWRSWYRVRVAAGLPIEAEACTESICRAAARVQVRKEVEDRLRREGCGTAAPVFAGASPKVARWSEEAWRQRCCRPGSACSTTGVELAGETE